MKRADLRWQLYDHAHWGWRKATAPTNAAQHIYSRERRLEETSSGQEARTPVGSWGANSSSFPPFLLALVMFILPDPSQKGVTTSETKPNSDYFLYLFKQCQCWIFFHRKIQDCQELARSYIKEPKIALVLHRQLILLLKVELNPTQVLLFSLHSGTDLPQNFTSLQLRNQAESSSSFFFHSRATAYLSLIH